MTSAVSDATDVVLIGAGIMSATLGVLLKELEPSLTIAMFEALRGLRAGKLGGLEQRRHRPCGQLRDELHAGAARRQRRHLQGAAGQCRVRPVAPALVLPGEEGRDRRSARLHPSGART